jgi:hypothetical protein
MPVVHDGGGTSGGGGVFHVDRVVPIAGGGGSEVIQVPLPAQEALIESQKVIKTITAGTPSGGFPTGATQGQFYIFASQPRTLYFLAPDNTWLALVAVPVT